jgi:hypothetical protein
MNDVVVSERSGWPYRKAADERTVLAAEVLDRRPSSITITRAWRRDTVGAMDRVR